MTCLFPNGKPGKQANNRQYPDIPCGSMSLYARDRCRGPVCTAANREAMAAYRDRLPVLRRKRNQ